MAATFVLALLVSAVAAKTVPGKEKNILEFSDEKEDRGPRVKEDVTWPGFPYLKQVSAVSVDANGNLHLFHRADRVWDAHTFDHTYRLTDSGRGPIPNDTVLVIDTSNGKILYSWGANRFYMPHGLTVDHYGNTWVTDVGLHQVFMFPSPEDNPDLMIGDPFIPGAGKNHLCQPSDVAVLRSGHFFVSDGYCNSRLLMFSPGGALLREIGAKDGLLVPHSLTLVPEHEAVCVADRENGRVLCYSTSGERTGALLATFENQGIGRVFAIDTRGQQLFLVNGPDLWQSSQSVSSDHGLVMDIKSGLTTSIWGPEKGFRQPHALSVSPDGRFVYVSEIDLSAPKRVYRFNIRD